MNGQPVPASLTAIVALARRGQLARAARMAELVASRTPLDSPEAMPLANIRGGVAFERGQLELAEACFEATIRLANERNEPLLAAKASSNLGSIAHLRGKAVLAASLYQGALQAYRDADSAAGEAQAEHNLGLVERERGDLEAAGVHATLAVAAARRSGDAGLVGLALTGAAESAIGQGAVRGARRTLTLAAAFVRKADDPLGLVEVGRVEALLALRLGQTELCLSKASKGYLVAQRLGGLQLAGDCAALAARASMGLHRTRLAAGFRLRAQRCFRALGAAAALRRLAVETA
jgi:tetratricopeptide (TPR) repeat protein